MTDDPYTTSAWDSADTSDFQTGPSSYHHPVRIIDSQDASPPANVPASQPRSSTDSVGRSWRGSPTIGNDNRETVGPNDSVSLVEASFDENVLRSLCELDCGVPLLLDRIKQSMISCREASAFLKKRAAIEDEYGKNMQKLARMTSETYGMNDGKAGSFVSSWQSAMKIHESMGESRIRFSQRLNEMSDELATLVKEVDKNRKQASDTKELATRYERALQESEAITEKCKNRLDITSEELERVLLQKEGESLKDNTVQPRQGGAGGKRAIGKAVAKGGLLLKGKNPGNIQRQEDDIRSRMSNASDAYRKAVTDTQSMRQEYFNFQLPRILRALKECTDEMDLGTQYHLTRYAFLFESTVLNDGSTLVPPNEEGSPLGVGLKATLEMIDNRGDFKAYMQNYAYARGPATPEVHAGRVPPTRAFLQLPPLPTHHSDKLQTTPSPNGTNGVQDRGRPTFGVHLADQMTRDNVELPPIMEKCCQAIEKYGIESQGIYRLSGTVTKVANLRQRLDKDLESVDLDAPEWSSDINNVASVMKMWLRELPDPLLTCELQQGFIDAAKIENDRLRHIRLHERVNDLPDANYATLKYFLGHLHRINQHAAENSMSVQNLAIVFGPTLFGQMKLNPANGSEGGMADATHQNQAIETILMHYTDIFVDDSE
ncbi:Rho GTPase activation protein [Mycena rosella]|uniref:Rho GTPase activation protein n=1 Tax=Mycena rosella TaxID=1033263 RepID=A0AAD7CX51_MYCRO|nr:Rho GTPase activation protein [Mycena rosella]